MHRDYVRAAGNEFPDKRRGALDHQVDVKRSLREWAQGTNQVRKEKQTRDEMSVGNVEVERVGERVQTLDARGQVSEIRRPQ